jgi:hypothetical protein
MRVSNRRHALPRFLKTLTLLTVMATALSGVFAQGETRLKAGDPPNSQLISISQPDEDGFVTIRGALGAVFPAAQLAIRNLYTGDTVYTQASTTGTFSTAVYGPGNTPFWISPATNIPTALRDQPGSLPGGPGTIIYGPFPQSPPNYSAATRLSIDGSLDDWSAYRSDALVLPDQPSIYALSNNNSIYIGLQSDHFPDDYVQMNIILRLDNNSFSLGFDPRLGEVAVVTRILPSRADTGSIAIAAAQGEAIEARIPRTTINPTNPEPTNLTFEQVIFIGADGVELLSIPVNQPIPRIDALDAITRPSRSFDAAAKRFSISGSLAAGRWNAFGRINNQSFAPGDTLILEMDVVMDALELPAGLSGLRMLGELRLQPVIGADGFMTAGGLGSNNGWSDRLTPSGLAISNLRGDFLLGETVVAPNDIIRQNDQLIFPLDFTITLPDDLPAGMYTPLFEGFGQVADGERFRWQDNSPLGAGDRPLSPLPMRLPLVLNVGAVTSGRLLWTLFQDAPSNGSRGSVAQQDQARYALANFVRFNSPTIILPPTNQDGAPITYPVEPYLLNQMPNTFGDSSAPLIPLLFPGGRLNARITRPDGEVDDLGSAAIIQSRLSTPELDESILFGKQSQTDVYRLTTLNPAFTAYTFSQYGEYTIELTGSMDDIWGNRYEAGGSYTVVIAEPLQLFPATLPGTPFEVGNTLHAGLHLAPAVAADVSVHVWVYPLDGSPVIERRFEGQASASGYFAPDEPFVFETPGEYLIDYEARYRDGVGRLWAGSVRSAGVIANPGSALIAHGARGLDDHVSELRPAWFVARRYAPDVFPALQWPYYRGDVAWIPDVTGQITPAIHVQDTRALYSAWLNQLSPDFRQPIIEQELPVATLNPQNDAYAYISATLPGLSVRQYIQGGTDGGLMPYIDTEDRLNQQIGAGLRGLSAGDFIFLFGGAVVRNDEANVRDTAIYGALAVVTEEDDPLGARVFPPYLGEAGAGNGGPLLTVLGEEIDLFFHPTAVRPGDVLSVGDTLSIAGQLGPTLPSVVHVQVTSPRGNVRAFSGVANAIGYFYDPANDFTVDEPGVWTVQIRAQHDGLTSVGAIEPPPPTGDVLGTDDGRFSVYVLPENSQPLLWNSELRTDFAIAPITPYNMRFEIPPAWTNVGVYHTVTIPGYVIEDSPLRPTGTTLTYQYNLPNLSKSFPMLENNGQGTGPSSSDVITLTFVITGTDANGRFQMSSRIFTITYDRLMTFG